MKQNISSNVIHSCKYFVVWCSKYRRNVLIGEVASRLKELIKETCDELSVEIINMEILPDHVKLLVKVDPKIGIYITVKAIKAQTSRALRTEFSDLCSQLPSLWTSSYFISTFGETPSAEIDQYLIDQTNV